MTQQQHVANVHPDELCLPNKQNDLMDANKKIDLEHVQCLSKIIILTNIIKNHPFQFSIAAFSFVPWIYMAQFWHTLKEDDLKYRLKFMLDKKELSQHWMTSEQCFTYHKQMTTIMIDSFTKTIIGHYMTNFPEISRRARDKYHNLKDDDIMKNIFNSRIYKDKLGMKIPAWMITEEMKHTEHYWMTPSAPRPPNPKMDAAESSAPKRSTMIRFCIPQRRSTHLTPPALVPTVDKAEEVILQDTLQVSLAEHKIREEQKARENVSLVDEHLASVEIKKIVEGQKNFIDDSSIFRNDEHNIPGTRLEPKSDKEKGKIIEEFRKTPFLTPIRSLRIYIDLVSLDTEKLPELTELQGRYGYLFEHLRARFMPWKSFATLADHLYEAMVKSLPTTDGPHDDVHPEGENSAKRQKTFEYEAYVSGESSSKQDNEQEQGPSTLGPVKIVLSLHKFPAVIFNDDDIKERTSRWVNKKQKDPRKPKEVIYSNSKITKVIKTYWELGHEHKFIIKIVARRANECIVSITEHDFKNLNKNDIEDMYLLIMNGKVPDYAKTWLLWSLSVFIKSLVIWERVHDFQLGIESYQQKVNLTTSTISFPRIQKHEMFFIIYEHVHGIIYKNSKKEKRVMRYSEIDKFCDATLNRVLEGLKSYNNDVKYGYIQKDLTKDEVEYLKLFKEEIEV
nr:hypothetical protein [Tanacetum cinerariifolium]